MNEAVDISDFKGSLDVRRKMFVARGRVSDLKRDCIIAKDEDFDVEHSIFSVFGRSLPTSPLATCGSNWLDLGLSTNQPTCPGREDNNHHVSQSRA